MLNNDLPLTNLQSCKPNRLERGFAFESETSHTITQYINYDYFQHNPTDYKEWLQNVGEGCDDRLVAKELVFNIECMIMHACQYG